MGAVSLLNSQLFVQAPHRESEREQTHADAAAAVAPAAAGAAAGAVAAAAVVWNRCQRRAAFTRLSSSSEATVAYASFIQRR